MRRETRDWRPEQARGKDCAHAENRGTVQGPPTNPTACRLQPTASPQRGMTLVELLVVIAIVSILVTTAIPVLAPGGDSRRLREASRAVNSFFAGARSRAIQTGRPYGVAIRRLSADTGSADDNGVGVQLSYVEVPPVYSGLDSGSLVRVGQVNNSATGQRQFRLQFLRRGVQGNAASLPPGIDLDLVPGSFLRIGDVVNVGGAQFRLTDGDGQTTLRIGRNGFFQLQLATLQTYALLPLIDDAPIEIALRYRSTGNTIDSPEVEAVNLTGVQPTDEPSRTYWSAPLPYLIMRQPTPSTAQPLQLPEGTAIDLQASGFTSGLQLHRPSDAYYSSYSSGEGTVFSDNVMVLFSPEGSISRAYFRPDIDPDSSNEVPDNPEPGNTNVTSTLALLVGRRELMPAEFPTNGNRDEPIVLDLANYKNTYEDEATRENLNKYNWLNPDSRWVVIGAQSGAVATVANAPVDPYLDVDGDGTSDIDWWNQSKQLRQSDGQIHLVEQLDAARENATRRNTSGR